MKTPLKYLHGVFLLLLILSSGGCKRDLAPVFDVPALLSQNIDGARKSWENRRVKKPSKANCAACGKKTA